MGGLKGKLDQAVVNGRSGQATIPAFRMNLNNSLDGMDCGLQVVSVMEPVPALKTGPFSDFISVSAYDPAIDGFNITVDTDNPEVGKIRTLVVLL